MRKVSFSKMSDGTEQDYLLLRDFEQVHIAGTATRVLRELDRQNEETFEGYQITRLEHALQAATRAYRDRADDDWIVAALLHDIGDGLAPLNHDRLAAEILRPFVRTECTWVVEHHAAFQMYYYAHHYGSDRNEREKYAENVYYKTCIDFCERCDQSSFDPHYVYEPLSRFAPLVHQIFQRKAYDETFVRPGYVCGLPRQVWSSGV